VLTPEEFHTRTFSSDRINVLITFDDGYDSWLRVVSPVLDQYGYKALFFINSGLLDVSGDRRSLEVYLKENLKLSPKIPLTWEGAEMLMKKGHTIGGHTVHHKSLRNIPREAVQTEVVDDKNVLEKKLSITITDFAYPFGISRDYSRDTEALIRTAGYQYVYIAEPGFVQNASGHLPRTLIESNQSVASIRRWLYGSYDLFVFLKQWLNRLQKIVHFFVCVA
jgi:peptidoglycan/xylan/chitin deacetylase (PgdA/CDA1 family)